MLRAIVKKPFPGVLDGEVLPREFAKGAEISGELACTAIKHGYATETKHSIAQREAAEAEAAAAKDAQENARRAAEERAALKASEFEKFLAHATDEDIAKAADHFKVDLTGITDRAAIFEKIWAASEASLESAR